MLSERPHWFSWSTTSTSTPPATQYALRDVLEPLVTRQFGESGFYFQQDWAPAHLNPQLPFTRSSSQASVQGTPSNSSDLNSMNYSVWSIMQQKISITRYATFEQLKMALMRSWNEITVDQCATIVSDFPKQLRKSN